MKKETLDTIAAKAGVSKTTVSRVLNDSARKYRISEQTEKTVRKIAKEFNYNPRPVAKNIRVNKSKIIGLIVPSIAEYFFASISSQIIRNNANHGYTTMLVEVQDNPAREKKEIENLISRNIAGMIIAPSSNIGQYLEFIDKEIPIIQIDRYIDGADISCVCSNNHHIGKFLTNYLVERGHRRIACIQGPTKISSTSERIRGYVEAMKEADLEPYLYGESFDSQESFFQTLDLLRSEYRPSAILSLANGQALGIIKAANKLGFNIPDDLSVVTVDDNKYMNFISPSITRITQPMENMAKLCCESLYRRLDDPNSKNTSSVFLMSTLIEGDSVKAI